MVAAAGVPDAVRERADAAFTSIAEAEGEIHGVGPEKVHLHEVGAVDAILDVVGSVWGLALLGVDRVYCGPIVVGDGTVKAAHGILPVPAPATLKLLEGHVIRPGPEGAGELVTPTGAALVRALSSGPAPASYTPLRSGYGAGTKEFANRANALRITLAEPALLGGVIVESLVQLATDVDDMDGEALGALADVLRDEGALDVVLLGHTDEEGASGHACRAVVHSGGGGSRGARTVRAQHARSACGVRASSGTRLPREEWTVLRARRSGSDEAGDASRRGTPHEAGVRGCASPCDATRSAAARSLRGGARDGGTARDTECTFACRDLIARRRATTEETSR